MTTAELPARAPAGSAGRAGAWVVAISSLLVALLSLRYLVPHAPETPANVAANVFARPWLPMHAILAALALLVGPVQFLRSRRGATHRWLGRVYVASCLAAAPAGLILAAGISTGPIATAGFGLLAVVWFATTACAWQAARERRWAAHRRWMIRSFALTFGAVLLRLYLVPVIAFHLDFDWWYRLISFATWVPNLVVVEVWMWSERTAGHAPG